MSYLLEHYPTLHFTLRVVVGSVMVSACIFNIFLIPMILNRKLDPILGPKTGDRWETGKSPAYPYYFVYKGRDYAKALISEKFARKQFSRSRDELRAVVSPYLIPLCYVNEFLHVTFMYFIFIPGALYFSIEWILSFF